MAAKLKQLLVKLLARRAAAYVELQQQQLLQQAAEDLEHALRWVAHGVWHSAALLTQTAPGERCNTTPGFGQCQCLCWLQCCLRGARRCNPINRY